MSLVCSSVDVPATIKEVGGFIVLVGGFTLSAWLQIKNSKKMDVHQQELRNIAAGTGTFKALPATGDGKA